MAVSPTLDSCKATEKEVDQGKDVWNKILKISGGRTVDGVLQMQLEEDGGCLTRQSSVETSGLLYVPHRMGKVIN